MCRQVLRTRITERKYIRNQHLKKLCPGTLLIHSLSRLAGFYNLAQLKPVRNQLHARMAQKSALKARLGAYQERRTLRSQAILPIRIFSQKIKSHQRVHNRGESALRSTRRLRRFNQRLWSLVQHIKDAVLDCSFKDERRGKTPRHLKNTFRRHRSRVRACHFFSLCSFQMWGIAGEA